MYRGANSEWNYCSCMDFKTSKLGTCKHLEAVKKWFSGNEAYMYIVSFLLTPLSIYLTETNDA